jgi:hypothetical protein
MTESFDETMARWAAETAQRKAQGQAKLREVLDALRALGVQAVTVEYDGYGDEGNIEEITIAPDGLNVPRAIEVQLEEACWVLCPEGFENGEGGCGTFEIDVVTGHVQHEHNDRYTELDKSEEAFDV